MDFRQDGIAWIIEKLVSENEKVYDIHLPEFLDGRAKEFLIMVLILALIV
jgi:hypothetical protein